MRLRNIPGSREKIAESIYVIKVENPDPDVPGADGGNIRGRWQEIFGNSNPVMIEIGMGKGAFIIENAKRFPKVNFVGIEKYSSVMLRAVEKQEEEKLPNLFFIRMEAEYICNVFAPGEVERIYLNFSDPWPKKRYAKRRLTSRQFLERYERILKEGGIVEFKTDNTGLFDFSLEEAREAGWIIEASVRDLHSDPMGEKNIMTEYEAKFSAQGQKICKMVSRPGGRKNCMAKNLPAEGNEHSGRI